jgi:hypothetical protein
MEIYLFTFNKGSNGSIIEGQRLGSQTVSSLFVSIILSASIRLNKLLQCPRPKVGAAQNLIKEVKPSKSSNLGTLRQGSLVIYEKYSFVNSSNQIVQAIIVDRKSIFGPRGA